jgi:ribose transport system ATP-binding protein
VTESVAQARRDDRNDRTPRAIEASGISKSFGGVHALHDASFSADFGEVHALVGENGAGKSTMIKILSGVLKPDEGAVRIKGGEVDLQRPHDAQALGVATVFQELTLMPWMTVAENLLIGKEPRWPVPLIRRRALPGRAAELLASYGVRGIDPLELVAALSLAQRQMLEIVRALLLEPEILFLDEPTSALAGREVEWLFGHVRALRERGTCVIFTSHRWGEVVDLADRITVFRNGEYVATRESIAESEAVTLMTGRTIDRIYPDLPAVPDDASVALEVRDLASAGVNGVSLELHRGEVLGIGGLAGQGQRELFMTLFGARKATGGQIIVGGKPRRIRRPTDAIRAGLGIALVPEDRKNEGLLLPMYVRDNLTLAILPRISALGVVRRRSESRLVSRIVERLQIRTRRPSVQEVGTLSGGNQQKVLIGRWLLTGSDVMLLYDITRGVDVATKHDIYELMVGLLGEGKALLFYSSETEETAHLCHRVIVVREGRAVTELAGEEADAEALVAASLREHARV